LTRRLPAQPAAGQVEVGGLPLRTWTWDGGGRTTVLLLHGFLDVGRTWTFLVEALPDDFDGHVVALDWRGHGESGWVGPGGYYHFADYARDLEVVTGAVRREGLVLVGHSMGAQAVGMWLGARPGGADAALLVEGLGPLPLSEAAYPGRMATWLDQTAPFDADRWVRPMRDLEHAASRLQRQNARLSAERARRLAGWATTEGPGGELVWCYDPLHRTTSPVPVPPAVAAHFWGQVRCPLGWVGGAESPWTGAALDAWLDGLSLRLRRHLPGAGHMVQNDQPQALAAALVEFLAAV
jgi:pimeloyl-ACP methyl ester carboxylesterase